jgi:hypothetical protein
LTKPNKYNMEEQILNMDIHKIDNTLYVPVPENTDGFYLSGMNYLCCRIPYVRCLHCEPLTEYGVFSNHQLGEVEVKDGEWFLKISLS